MQPEPLKPAALTLRQRVARSDAFVLAIWLLLQILSLAISAMDIRFSANFIRPAERAAVEQLLAIQIICAAFLSPILLDSISRALIIGGACMPMLLLAHQLEPSWGFAAICRASVSLGLWLSVLALGQRQFRLTAARQLLATAASLWSVGGVAVHYVVLEYPPKSPISPYFPAVQGLLEGPVMAAMCGRIISPVNGMLMIVVFCVGMKIGLDRFSRAKLSTHL